MSDRANNSLAALLTPTPAKGVQFSQGVIMTWDRERGHNTLDWRGITLTDIPFVEGVNPLVLQEGDVVGMLGWAPENAKGVGSWWILGKLTMPGDFVTDLTFNLGQIRFLAKDSGYDQAYFGYGVSGLPLTTLYYGDEASTPALTISGTNSMILFDSSGRQIFTNDSASGTGIGRPYFNIPMVPSSGTTVAVGGPFWPAFTNAAFQEVMHSITTIWHPKIAVSLNQSVTAGTIDWELRVDGVTAGSASGSGSLTVDVPGWGTTNNPGAQVSVQIFARNTSGTQSRLMVDRCYGRQT